jgi:hypothetical protein
MLIHRPFDVSRDGARAFVEHAVFWQVIKQSRDAHLHDGSKLRRASQALKIEETTNPLLLAATENVLPFLPCVETWVGISMVRHRSTAERVSEQWEEKD